MKTRNTRIAGLAAAGVLLGGGLAGAFAATSGGDDRAADLAGALSKQTGGQVSSADVKAAFKDVLAQRLNEGVASGRITRAQADEMLKRAESAPLRGFGARGGPDGHRLKGGGMHEARDAVAKKLGMTGQQLHDAREKGATLAQIAAGKGVSRDALIRTVTGAINASDRGADLTDAQAAAMATRIVDGGGGKGMHRGGLGHHGPGGHGMTGP